MRRQYMLKNSKRLMLGLPYYFWSIAFIIIPLFMVVYYGVTDRSGSLTIENITAISVPEHFKALLLAVRLSVISTISSLRII